MTPEVKAAITYFLIFVLVGVGLIVQGFNLKKTKVDSPVESKESKSETGQILIIIGAVMIIWQAYELYQKML